MSRRVVGQNSQTAIRDPAASKIGKLGKQLASAGGYSSGAASKKAGTTVHPPRSTSPAIRMASAHA